MNKIIIPIQGMHCRSCEMLIESELSEVKGAKKVKADYRRSVVEIYYELTKPDIDEIAEAVKMSGYKIGEAGKQPFLSKDIKDYRDLSVAFLFLVIIYLIAKISGIANFSLPQNSSGLLVVLLVGLTAGLSTCMVLVGGLVLGFSARHSENHPEATAIQKFRPHIFFNIGRILGFAFLGGLLGAAGSFLQLSGFTTGVITIFVGIVMLVLGFQLIEIFPRLAGWKITFPKQIAKFFGLQKDQKEYSHKGVFITGALTFFLPCGFTQAMQLLAIESGSFFSGAAVMAVFSLGTAPGLLGIGGLTSFIKRSFAKKFFKFAGLAVIFLSLFNIANGYRLAESNFDFNNSPQNQQGQTSEVKNGNQIQTINMEVSGSYYPNQFTVKNGIPVRWVINVKNPYTCAVSFLVPRLGVRKILSAGENIIEFTPKETGRINFSCSMGMYTGFIDVVN